MKLCGETERGSEGEIARKRERERERKRERERGAPASGPWCGSQPPSCPPPSPASTRVSAFGAAIWRGSLKASGSYFGYTFRVFA